MGTTTHRSEKRVLHTTNLRLAAYLISEGCQPELVRDGDSSAGHPIGAWQFDMTSELDKLITLFGGQGARVEPNNFHEILTKTRRDMFDFLGI